MNDIEEFDFKQVNTKNFGGHIDEVNCAALSTDFEIMVTGSDDNGLRIFNTVSGELVTTVGGHQGAIKAVTISPNSQFIASASYDKTVRIWVTRTARCLHVLRGHTKSVECVAFSRDSSLLCSGSWDKTAVLWNVECGKHVWMFEGHHDLVQSVAFSYDGSLLATGSWDYTVRVWRVQHTGVTQVKHHGSDDRLKLTIPDNDDDTTLVVHKLHGHHGNIHTVAFSQCDKLLASGSWDKTVRLWDVINGSCLFVLEGHGGWVQAVAFSSDGEHLVSAGDHDVVIVWSCSTGKCVCTLDMAETESVSQCAFGPKGIIVTSASGILKTATRSPPIDDTENEDDTLLTA